MPNSQTRFTACRSSTPRLARRTLLAAGLCAALAGCMDGGDAEAGLSGSAPALAVRSVDIDLSQLETYELRGLSVAREQFAADLKARLEVRLGTRLSAAGQGYLVLSPARVALRSPGQAAVGGGRSLIEATIVLRRVEDGNDLRDPFSMVGRATGARLPGVVGLVTSPDPATDYQNTLTGFSDAVIAEVFGDAEA